MTSTIDAARQVQRQELKPEPVGHEWLSDFRQLFADEFPEDVAAHHAVEGHAPVERVPTARPRRA